MALLSDHGVGGLQADLETADQEGEIVDKSFLKIFVDYLIKLGIIKNNFTGVYTLKLSFRYGSIRDVRYSTENVVDIKADSLSIS